MVVLTTRQVLVLFTSFKKIWISISEIRKKLIPLADLVFIIFWKLYRDNNCSVIVLIIQCIYEIAKYIIEYCQLSKMHCWFGSIIRFLWNSTINFDFDQKRDTVVSLQYASATLSLQESQDTSMTWSAAESHCICKGASSHQDQLHLCQAGHGTQSLPCWYVASHDILLELLRGVRRGAWLWNGMCIHASIGAELHDFLYWACIAGLGGGCLPHHSSQDQMSTSTYGKIEI